MPDEPEVLGGVHYEAGNQGRGKIIAHDAPSAGKILKLLDPERLPNVKKPKERQPG
jgi:hypothetical protein